jgi:hypothetical protein
VISAISVNRFIVLKVSGESWLSVTKLIRVRISHGMSSCAPTSTSMLMTVINNAHVYFFANLSNNFIACQLYTLKKRIQSFFEDSLDIYLKLYDLKHVE